MCTCSALLVLATIFSHNYFSHLVKILKLISATRITSDRLVLRLNPILFTLISVVVRSMRCANWVVVSGPVVCSRMDFSMLVSHFRLIGLSMNHHKISLALSQTSEFALLCVPHSTKSDNASSFLPPCTSCARSSGNCLSTMIWKSICSCRDRYITPYIRFFTKFYRFFLLS